MDSHLPAHTTDFYRDEHIRTLSDGFEVLGDRVTPFTIRGSSPTQEQAQARHDERSADEKRGDELRHEPITRDLEEWTANMMMLDFPGVDTIPPAIRQERAGLAAAIAQDEFGVSEINRNVEFDDPRIRGRYWRGSMGAIELRTVSDDFPGYMEGPLLAHEVGHAVDDNSIVRTGFVSEHEGVFNTDREHNQAFQLSERLRGPIVDVDGVGANYRKLESELVADAFAARIIEPETATEKAPAAIERLESVFGEFFEEFEDRAAGADCYATV